MTGAGAALTSHRGLDPGALATARVLSRRLDAPLIATTITRLLVDMNREESNPSVFSEWSRPLDKETRERLLLTLHRPFRTRVRDHVHDLVRRGRRVVHISSHTFTPELRGKVRELDVGILYDPSRHLERLLAGRWKHCLMASQPGLRVRLNQPYLGTADGLTRWLRGQFADADYVGLELELNQALLSTEPRRLRRLRAALATTLEETLNSPATSAPGSLQAP